MRAEEKGYSIYALIAGRKGHVVYTTEAARAVYRRHYTGKNPETAVLFSGGERVAMYQLEELWCTQQYARIRRGVWSLWLHEHDFELVSEGAQELLKQADGRDQAAANRIKLRPRRIFCEKNDLAEQWEFKQTKRLLSFEVSVTEYAEACHQAADVRLSLPEYCRERHYATMPPRQSISELCRCLQCAETTGRLADAVVKQGILSRGMEPGVYAQLAVEVVTLQEEIARLRTAINEMIRKES